MSAIVVVDSVACSFDVGSDLMMEIATLPLHDSSGVAHFGPDSDSSPATRCKVRDGTSAEGASRSPCPQLLTPCHVVFVQISTLRRSSYRSIGFFEQNINIQTFTEKVDFVVFTWWIKMSSLSPDLEMKCLILRFVVVEVSCL